MGAVVTATLPPAVDTRDCRLYRFYGWDPRTNYTTKTLIYVGETVRQPLTRLLEHLADKPWADTIAGWEVDDRVFAGKADVLAAEQAVIEAERPLYNYEFNLGNPERVEIWRQERQRWARDDATGRPRWVKPVRGDDIPAQRAPAAPVVRRVPAGRPGLPPWRQKAAVWVCAWILLTVTGWAWLDRHSVLGGHGPRWHGAVAATTAAMLLVWGCQRRARRARRRRTR